MKLSVMGSSPGNGHPYSWSAIFNGFDKNQSEICPFPVIPTYLSEQQFPDNFLTQHQVSKVWSQDREDAQRIQRFSRVESIANTFDEALEGVDAVLLARDDGENHPEMAEKILKKGLPVFVDKPFVHTRREAEHLFQLRPSPTSLFTCSSLRYSLLTQELKQFCEQKPVEKIVATTPKQWATYGMHILEPVLCALSFPKLSKAELSKKGAARTLSCFVPERELTLEFQATGEATGAISFVAQPRSGDVVEFRSSDTFACFKKSLQTFVDSIGAPTSPIPDEEVLLLTDLLERGLS